jgi:PPM family protein phosphatase
MDEITAEYAVSEVVAATELRVRPRVTVACKTDLGRVRENNEDKFEYFMPEDDASLAARGQLFVVCDGMGGHAAGQIASELAAKTFIDVYLHHPSTEVEAALKGAVAAANRFVLDVSRAVPGRQGMGTTLSGLALVQDRAFVAQVGDSRVYRFRGGELEMLTRDHTWVEDAVAQGVTREAAEAHPYRHVLTRAVGTEDDVQADVFSYELQVGDVFLLCSDGLLNHVPDSVIGDHLSSYSPSEATWWLVGRALWEGGSENITVLIVRVDDMSLA